VTSFPGAPVLVEVPAGSRYARIYDRRYYREGIQLRAFGPQPRGRWDHFPAGAPRPSPALGILYLAGSLVTATAEVFGDTRRVAPLPEQRLAAVVLDRPVLLADTRGRAAVELGVPAGALRSRDRALTQAVSRALHATTPAQGVLFESWHTGDTCVCLWERAADAVSLEDDRPLLDPLVLADLTVAAVELYYET
jgi:hypothetical protein